MELEQSIKEIIRIEARGNTSWAFMTDGSKEPLKNSINELEKELVKWNFVRIHPMHLINPLHFKHLSKIVLPHITMSDGALLPTDSNLVDFKNFNRPQKKHWWQNIFPHKKPKKRFNMKRNLLSVLLTICIAIGMQAQSWHNQTDWSGGPGQTGSFLDATMFNSQSEIDYTTVPGEITGNYSTKPDFLSTIYYNGKMIIGTSIGVFSFDPVSGQWDYIFNIQIDNFTILDGKLYGNNRATNKMFEYDDTSNENGLGFKGWKFHSDIPYGQNCIYTFEGELLFGTRIGSTGFVYKWDGAQWVQKGSGFETGVFSMYEYKNELYVGTHWFGDIWKWNGTGWAQVLDTPGSMMQAKDFVEYNGDLYVGFLRDGYAIGSIMKFDGSIWSTEYTGNAIYSLAVADGVLYAATNNNTSTGSCEVLESTGGAFTQSYTTTTEDYIICLGSDGTNLYHGAYGGTPTGDFYTNGIITNQMNVGTLLSSEIPVAETDIVKSQITKSVSATSGVKVHIQGTSVAGQPIYDVSEGFEQEINDTKFVYTAYLWSTDNSTNPIVSEIRFRDLIEQTITFDAIGTKTYGDSDFALTVTGGGSGNPVYFTSSDPAIVSVSDATGNWMASVHTLGDVTITAYQDGNVDYAKGETFQNITVIKSTPTITTLPTAAGITYGDALSAATLSGGAASVAGTFAYDDNSITPAAGTYSAAITFIPTDADNYNSVGGNNVNVVVAKATPTLTTLPTAAGITYGDALSAATLSGGAGSVAGTFAYDDNTITPNAGTYSAAITFSPTDAANYNTVAGNVDVAVAKASQTITFTELDDVTKGDEDFQLTATSDSDLEISYSSSNTEVATVSGNIVHIVGAGTTLITASQEGNENYLAAEVVTQELVVQVPSFTDDNIKDYMLIYPNPTKNNLFIKGTDMGFPVTIKLYSITGTLIYTLQHSDLLTPAKIDLSHLKVGYYLIRINNDEFTHTRKIMKK